MTLKIEMEMDNAAFLECSGNEVARILREIACFSEGRQLDGDCDLGPPLDLNGNVVGKVVIK